MKEYEHSFKAKSIIPYLDYCKENGYTQLEVIKQNRVVYHNKNSKHIIARITTDITEHGNKIVFDFKNIESAKQDLKISKESMPLELDEERKKIVLSMLDVLEFYVAADNLRTRYVFNKDGVTFEIDDYERPQMKVIAIEGDEDKVEKVYHDVLSKISE